jgi:hypothetical protein
VIELNRKILLTVLVLAAVLVATPYIGMVHAKPPTDTLFYVPLEGFGGTNEYRQAGNSNNWILYSSTYGNLEGDIVGTMTAEAHWIWHFEDEWVGPELDPLMENLPPYTSNGGSVLTVDPDTVMGIAVTGTLTLKFVESGTEFAGTWVIKGGTDDLKGITGQGKWYMEITIVDPMDPSTWTMMQVFEGKIHFDP